jgi:hypothetical protein
MNLRNSVSAAMIVLLMAFSVWAHGNRRLEIIVQDGQIAGQGYLTNGIDDGGGITRPYVNAIHSHFAPVGNTGLYNNITGFDLVDAEPFEGSDLVLTLMGAGKWANPPAQDGTLLAQDFGTPQLSPLDPSENIEVFFGAAVDPVATTDSLGSFNLIDSVSGPVTDIDLLPLVDFDPSGSLYFLEWTLSTTNPLIADSESIYTILSPPGDNPVDRFHFQSLALERTLSVNASAIPEPGSLVCLVVGGIAILSRRKRR